MVGAVYGPLSVCHETFGSMFYFDAHRDDGRCLHPLEIPGVIRLEWNVMRRAWTRRDTREVGHSALKNAA